MRRLALTCSLLIASALALTSGSAGAYSGADSGRDEHPAPPSGAGVASVYSRYVALGDSYAAAPFVPDPVPEPAGCIRSTNNYAAIMAGYLELDSYRDVTCSGAATRDMANPQQTSNGVVPPQFDALRANTDLVTITLGGNDFGLFGDLIGTCPRLHQQQPNAKNPCQREFTKNGVDTKLRDAAAIESHLTWVLGQIRQRSPKADVVLVSYPRILPNTGTCAKVPFAPGDYRWGAEIASRLNLSLKNAAAARGALFVNMHYRSQGHDACQGAKAWVNGFSFRRAAPFHPFLRGEQAMAIQATRNLAAMNHG